MKLQNVHYKLLLVYRQYLKQIIQNSLYAANSKIVSYL